MPGPVHPQERALCCTALVEHDGGAARAALTLQAVVRQVDEGVSHDDAGRRDALLPLALAAMEAALRRLPDTLGCAEMRREGKFAYHVRSPRRLSPCHPMAARCLAHTDRRASGCALSMLAGLVLQARPAQTLTCAQRARAQAVGHAVEVLLCLGACKIAPPAARALLSTLAKLFAMAHAPGSALCAELRVRRIGVRQPRRPSTARRVHANKPVCVRLWCLTWRSRNAFRTPCLFEQTVPESLKPGEKPNIRRAAGGARRRVHRLGSGPAVFGCGPPRGWLCAAGRAGTIRCRPAAARPAPVARARARAGAAAPLAARRHHPRVRFPIRPAGEQRLYSLCASCWRGARPGVNGLLCAAGRLRPARSARRPQGVQGARAGMRGPGAVCCRGAAQAGRWSLEPATCAPPSCA
jgi:hypothetical protein